MKKPTFAALAVIASLALTASAQVKSVAVANNHTASKPAAPTQSSANATRVRVLTQDEKPLMPGESVAGASHNYTKPDFNSHSDIARVRRTNASSDASPEKTSPGVTTDNSKVGGSGRKATDTTNPSVSPANSVATSAAITTASSQLYRVGVSDVLDIQLSDNPSRNSTLFTVLEGGVLEYPLAGGPIAVGGLTTPEIAQLLRQRIKIFENPNVVVSVRDYASHSVTITGFVAAPGTKILRREAVPLYTILAEALVLPEGGRATITHQGRAPLVVDLKDANRSSTLVVPGDAIKVSGVPPAPTEFFFIGGQINAPGQKPYHSGLTLTQAILASNGTSAGAGSRVKVSRQGADGRLATEEYNLRKIQAGKSPDPVLQKGDRIEVTTAN